MAVIEAEGPFQEPPLLTMALLISGASTVYTALLAFANREDSSFAYLLLMLVPLAAAFIGSAMASDALYAYGRLVDAPGGYVDDDEQLQDGEDIPPLHISPEIETASVLKGFRGDERLYRG